jgi:hypothetical protein
MQGMTKNTTRRPKQLTKAERQAWNHIVSEMKSRGIDPDSRVELIRDYVRLEARIARLESREDVNPLATPQQLDLGEIENPKRVQRRLIDLGFLFGAADGIWGQGSRRALREFRAANGRDERHRDGESQEKHLNFFPP